MKGIICEVTWPKLRKTLEKSDCTFAGLVKVAELTESRNLLEWGDPVMTKYIADVSQGTAPSGQWGLRPGITLKPLGWRFQTIAPRRLTMLAGLMPPAINAGRWAI